MAELRLHIRPRLGKAMSQASDGIVPMAARAMTRRASGRIAGGPLPESTGEQSDLALASGLPSSPAERADGVLTGTEPVRSEQDRFSSSPSARGPERPALRLVAENGDTSEADAPRVSNFARSKGLEPEGRGVITSAAQAAMDRRAIATSNADLHRLLTEGPSLVTPFREARVTGAPAGVASRAGSEAAAAQVNATANSSSDVSPVMRDTNGTAPEAPKRSPSGATANPLDPRRDPPQGTSAEVARTAGTTPTPSDPRPTGDPKDAIATLLMPALPAAAPTLANTTTPPETDFEFELRVRAALENILSEDLLRHGLFTPEVL